MSDDRPRVGISACLLGAPVRFDGGHKRDPFLIETLGRLVDWVPVCPEDEAGLGTPRDPMQLVADRPAPRHGGERVPTEHVSLVVIRTGADVTDRLRRYAAEKVEALAEARISGFVLKKDSPSCGMEGVRVFSPGGDMERAGRGLFAEALMARFPSLPVAEEGQLADSVGCENFLERVLAYRRLVEVR